jgi:hypothetical protein
VANFASAQRLVKLPCGLGLGTAHHLSHCSAHEAGYHLGLSTAASTGVGRSRGLRSRVPPTRYGVLSPPTVTPAFPNAWPVRRRTGPPRPFSVARPCACPSAERMACVGGCQTLARAACRLKRRQREAAHRVPAASPSGPVACASANAGRSGGIIHRPPTGLS